MKFSSLQQAPAFSAHDVYGKSVSIGGGSRKPTLLTFMRYAGCPVCHYRTTEMMLYYPIWYERGLNVIAVYESAPDIMREYIDDLSIPFSVIADPECKLYDLYNVERSFTIAAKSVLRDGFLLKVLAGNKLYIHKPVRDGHSDRISADFLIDAQGMIQKAHYGSYISDHISASEITAFADVHSCLDVHEVHFQ